MEDRLYLFEKNKCFVPSDNQQQETHKLAAAAFLETYMASFRGVPLYADVEMEYEGDSARIHTGVYGWLGNGFLIDSEELHQWIPDLYFLMRNSTKRYTVWANPEFEDKFHNGRNENIIDTYPSFDIIHSLYVLKSEITNKNSKQVLTLLA